MFFDVILECISIKMEMKAAKWAFPFFVRVAAVDRISGRALGLNSLHVTI
jgi:hypothetical protein